jgi:hypothetical protein
LVFVQVEEKSRLELKKLLVAINDFGFTFMILPMDAKIITKVELKELIDNAVV